MQTPNSFGIILFSLIGCITPGKVAEQASPETIEEEPSDTSSETEIDTSSQQDTDDTGTLEPVDTGVEEPVEPPNLLLNSSFEDGEEHWNIWGGASRPHRVEVCAHEKNYLRRFFF